MRSILHSLVLAPALLAAAAFTTTSAKAETTVNVPFTFTVAGKPCPAGLYILQRDPIHSFVTLMGKNAPVGFNWNLGPGDGVVKESNIKLSFEKEGEGYALESIQYGSQATHRLNKKPKDSEHRQTRILQGQGQ
jgi:hypothetical protein